MFKIKTVSWSIVIVLILALGLRLWGSNQSFWLDEAAQALESVRPFSEQFNLTADFQPPLFHLLVHILSNISIQEWWLRLASIVPALITIGLTMKLANRLWGELAATIAGLWLATAQFHVYYSQELRPYALAAMWAMWSMNEFYLIISQKRKSGIYLGLINAAGFYTMYLYPLLGLSQLIIAGLWYRKVFLKILISLGISFGLFLPWLPSLWQQWQTGLSWLTTMPGWGQAVSPSWVKMAPLVLIKLTYGRIEVDPTVADLITLLSLWIPMWWCVTQISKVGEKRWLVAWLVIPVAAAWLISIKVPVLEPKRVLWLLPAGYILIVGGIKRTISSLVAILLILGMNVASLTTYYTQLEAQREPWRQLITSLDHDSSQLTSYWFAFPEPLAPWQWYVQKSMETVAVVPKNLSSSEWQALADKLSPGKTIVCFDYLMDLTDPERKLHAWFETQGWVEQKVWNIPNIGMVRWFSPLIGVLPK